MRFLVRIFFITVFIFSSGILSAQGSGYPYVGLSDTDPCTDPFLPFCDCPQNANIPPCPIDGGLVALLAAGIGIGVKRVRDLKKDILPSE